MATDNKTKMVNITRVKKFDGTAGFFLNVTKALLNENCKVLAIVPVQNEILLKRLKEINNENLSILPTSKNKFKEFYQKIKSILKFKPNLILTHNYNISILFISKLLGIKTACSIYFTGEIKFYRYKYLIDLVLPAKQHQIQAIKDYFPNAKMLYFPYCSDFQEKEIKKNKQEKFTLGCLGVMESRKGFKELILACDILKNKKKLDFQLLLGGNGAEMENLKTLVKEKNLQNVCKFMDYIYDKDDFYSKLDLFCFTSYSEDIGFIVSEAISYKVPIVGNNIGFVSDILDDNDLLIVPSKDVNNPEKIFKKGKFIKAWFELKNSNYRMVTQPLEPYILADKIEYAINNYPDMLERAENVYKKIKDNYSVNASVKKLLKITKSLS